MPQQDRGQSIRWRPSSGQMLIYVIPGVIALVFTFLYEFSPFPYQQSFYKVMLVYLAVFSGLRFQTGRDWDNYEVLWLSINPADPPFFNYAGSVASVHEIGYYLLNYAVKWAGGSLWMIYFASSLFCFYGLYRFTRRYPGNKFYILLIYLSYCFVDLHFAQVRQSIALGFFLWGMDNYLEHGKKWRAMAIALIGPLFQYSSVIYIGMFFITVWWPKKGIYRAIATITIGSLLIIPFFVDPYELVASMSPALAASKVESYQQGQVFFRFWQVVHTLYVMGMAAYFYFSRHLIRDEKRQFILNYAIASLVFTALMVVVFPGSLVMYWRVYLVASVFQGFAATLLFKEGRNAVHPFIFAVTAIVSFAFYNYLLQEMREDIIPYRWVIGVDDAT